MQSEPLNELCVNCGVCALCGGEMVIFQGLTDGLSESHMPLARQRASGLMERGQVGDFTLTGCLPSPTASEGGFAGLAMLGMSLLYLFMDHLFPSKHDCCV